MKIFKGLLFAVVPTIFVAIAGVATDISNSDTSIGSNSSSSYLHSKSNKSKTSDGDGFAQYGDELITGEGLDYLKLYNSINADSPQKRYYKSLIEAYILASEGKLSSNETVNDNLFSPAGYANIHRKETTYGTFAQPYSSSVKTDIDIWSSSRNNPISSNTGEGVWFDAGKNPDGLPDGPFQFVNGKGPGAEFISNKNSTGSWDVYNFGDQLTGVSHYVKQAKLVTNDEPYLSIASVISHNRGSVSVQLQGRPFDEKSSLITTSKLNKEVYNDLFVNFWEPLYTGKEKYNLQSPHKDSVPVLVLLALRQDNYYFSYQYEITASFETIKGISNIMNRDGVDNHYKQIFKGTPQENYTYEEFVEWVNTVKRKPLTETANPNADNVYGTTNGWYTNSYGWSSPYQNLYVYKVHNTSNGHYKNDTTAKDVTAWDFVTFRYPADILFGEASFVELALLAGLPDSIDGELLDPSNPKYYYKSITSFNPFTSNTGASTIFQMLNVKVNEYQVAQLQAGLDNRGPYVWGGGGKDISYANIMSYHISSKDPVTKTNDNIFLLNNGQLAKDKSTDADLKYSGIRITDCSSFASVIANLNMKTFSNGGGATNRSTRGWAGDVGKAKTLSYNGAELDATLLQVNPKDGKGYTTSSGSWTITKELLTNLKPMDVLNSDPAGHAFVFVGINKSGQEMVIPAKDTFLGKEVRVSAGDALFFEQGGYSNTLPRIKGEGSQSSSDFNTRSVPSNYLVYRYKFNE